VTFLMFAILYLYTGWQLNCS